jgi:hypothetical protein
MEQVKKPSKSSKFRRNIKQGRRFEHWERMQWEGGVNELAQFEAPTRLKGKRGRIDIRLRDDDENQTVVVEIKSTNWDVMKSYRIRPNVLRHARQLWRYIEAEMAYRPVIPAIIYPVSPKRQARKREIENILHERFIQVVWRDQDYRKSNE